MFDINLLVAARYFASVNFLNIVRYFVQILLEISFGSETFCTKLKIRENKEQNSPN